MQVACRKGAAVTLNDLIYATILLAAGADAVQKPSAIEQFNPLTNIWSDSNIAQLKEELSGHYTLNIDLRGL